MCWSMVGFVCVCIDFVMGVCSSLRPSQITFPENPIPSPSTWVSS